MRRKTVISLCGGGNMMVQKEGRLKEMQARFSGKTRKYFSSYQSTRVRNDMVGLLQILLSSRVSGANQRHYAQHPCASKNNPGAACMVGQKIGSITTVQQKFDS